MRYPDFCKNIIDVTKSPYFADKTGKTDCTKALQAAIDDCLRAYVDGIEKVRQELIQLHEKYGGNVYVGEEAGKYIDGEIYITLPKITPPVKSLFFPNGTYLVSDTVSYTFDNLSTRQSHNYTCELCRFIQIFGESKENTVIRLADHSEGFEKGCKKPVISFNRVSKEDTETTNCAQMNTLEDITIDCGKGNNGAIGVLYASSNCGRIENVTIKSVGGFCGLDFDYGSEACVRNIKIEGFDYGIRTGHTSPLVMDYLDLSENKVAGILTKNGNITLRNINCGNIPLFSFQKGQNGRYYCSKSTPEFKGDTCGNSIFIDHDAENKLPPFNPKFENLNSWACVDEFGAVGDGQTDCAVAIQRAMDSGKEVIVFGEGCYKIEKTVKIPASVKTIDFRYASIAASFSLIIGEIESMFEICEESELPFFAEHLALDACLCGGFYRMFKQSAKRTAVFRDVIAHALYFNTVGSSEVYFDNCFVLSPHYSQDAGLHRDGYVPVFCRTIPIEVHNQQVYAKNLNIERADVEFLNDHSTVVIDGYKVEGPGILVKSINNAFTKMNLFNAAWWGNKIPDNALFESHDSKLVLTGGNIFCYPSDEKYCMAFRIHKNTDRKYIYLKECSEELEGLDALGRSWGCLIKKVNLE